MKTIIFLLLSIIVFSCTQETVNPAQNTPTPSPNSTTSLEQSLLGKWKFTKSIYWDVNDTNTLKITSFANGDYQIEGNTMTNTFITYPTSINMGCSPVNRFFILTDTLYQTASINTNYVNQYKAIWYNEGQYYPINWIVIDNYNDNGIPYINFVPNTKYIKYISNTELICQDVLQFSSTLFTYTLYYYTKIN